MRMVEQIKKKIIFIIPPMYDCNMPTMTIPALLSNVDNIIDKSIICDTIDLNAIFFNGLFPKVGDLKKQFETAVNNKELDKSILAWYNIHNETSYIQYGDKEFLRNRKLDILQEWYSSDEIEKFLSKSSTTMEKIGEYISNLKLDEAIVFSISVSVEDQIVPAFITMKILKRIYPNTKIIVGGNIVSRLFMQFIESSLVKYFDFLIYGEGENVIIDLINHLTSRTKLKYHKQIYDVSNGNTITEHESDCVQYDKKQALDFDWVKKELYLTPFLVLPISISRKCSWAKCDFCAIHKTWNKLHRRKSVETFIEEIRSYNEKYGVKFFRIIDEDLPPDLALEISQKVIDSDMEVYFEAYVRFDDRFNDSHVMNLMFQAGFRQLFWGIENINDKALKKINKGTVKKDIEEILVLSSKSGMLNYCFILIGIPSIPEEYEMQTLEFIMQCKHIHSVAMGTYVVDRLSPIHQNTSIQKKYSLKLAEVGDMTTELKYIIADEDYYIRAKKKCKEYIYQMFSCRKDLAISSIFSEEARFILTTEFTNNFINKFINSGNEISAKLVSDAIERHTNERVNRGKI